ncbi:MAG: hypothetical protein WAT71_13850 [Ignavibacteria bacterium]
MSKVIYTILFLITLCLITVTGSKSQSSNTEAPINIVKNSEADTNLQSKFFKLYQNEETESNQVTVIKFDLMKEAVVILNVTDNSGKIIDYLVDGEMLPGTYCVHFKNPDITTLKDMSYKIEVNGETETRKMVIK